MSPVYVVLCILGAIILIAAGLYIALRALRTKADREEREELKRKLHAEKQMFHTAANSIKHSYRNPDMLKTVLEIYSKFELAEWCIATAPIEQARRRYNLAMRESQQFRQTFSS